MINSIFSLKATYKINYMKFYEESSISYKNYNLVPRVLSLPPSRKYPGLDWSRVTFKQTAPHQGGLAFLQEAKGKANANLFKLARRQSHGSH